MKYLDDAGIERTATVSVVITQSNIGDHLTLSGSDSWYSIRGNVSAVGGIKVNGDVNLILEDDSHLTATGTDGRAGIEVSAGKSLTIYAQSTGASAGKLTASGGPFGGAGIGSAVAEGQFFDARDGKMYAYVTIGGKKWMAENLNYETASGSYCYGDDPSNCDTYGRLYTWSAAMDISSSYNSILWGGSNVNHQGVCPDGWHLPSHSEWSTLTSYVGSDAGEKLKSTSGWNNSGNGTDDYGFSALPGGYRHSGGSFGDAGRYSRWWSSTEDGGTGAWNRRMYYNLGDVNEDVDVKLFGLSVRCVRN